MSGTVIKAEGLGKRYTIGHHTTKEYKTFRDQMVQHAQNFYSRTKKLLSGQEVLEGEETEEFWALKDLNFEIKQGDRVGIIGKNGAGKSTLLKVLSRITEPTTGKVFIKGRIASLLEVGTGFHPELTGRENIFLNGAILGMNRNEIKRKFDEIVDFSGVEKFLDTPVKRYSSGMYVRLAFSVAAHLEPEILVVDEVLAVGDAEFQKKCLGKMQDVSATYGRTVLFVSHSMAAIKSLCSHGIVLNQGKNVFCGSQYDAINFYQAMGVINNSMIAADINSAPGNENIRVLKLEAVPQTGHTLTIFSGLTFHLEFFNVKAGLNIDITLEVRSQDNIVVFHSGGFIAVNKDSQKGVYELKCVLPKRFLNAGVYTLSVIFGENQRYILYRADDLLTFEIFHETSGSNSNKFPGLTFPEIEIVSHFKS